MRGWAGHFKGENDRKASEELDAAWTALLTNLRDHGWVFGISSWKFIYPWPSWDNVLVGTEKGG